MGTCIPFILLWTSCAGGVVVHCKISAVLWMVSYILSLLEKKWRAFFGADNNLRMSGAAFLIWSMSLNTRNGMI